MIVVDRVVNQRVAEVSLADIIRAEGFDPAHTRVWTDVKDQGRTVNAEIALATLRMQEESPHVAEPEPRAVVEPGQTDVGEPDNGDEQGGEHAAD